AREALAELAESGESVAQFARRRGVSAQRIYYWKKRIAESAAPAFVAVPLTTARAGQIEIATDVITIRVREDLDAERLADILGAVARHGRGC
ncbi:MAG: IS66 family insertion sequence element accessory protein TnpA, partial [Polyangiales bacterium]